MSKKEQSFQDFFGDNVVTSYTRARAIEDGVLQDLSAEAIIVGFVFPVACSSGVSALIKSTDDTMDLLFKLKELCKKSKDRRIDFEFKGEKVYSLVGPGDKAEPVITIMTIYED